MSKKYNDSKYKLKDEFDLNLKLQFNVSCDDELIHHDNDNINAFFNLTDKTI